MIATVADRFHQLPSAVARDLDEDPEQLSLECVPLLHYAEAKSVYDRAKDKSELGAWEDSPVMELQIDNYFQLAKEKRERRRRREGAG